MNAGVERRPDDAPADLVARLLRTYDVDPEVLHDLAALYRRARYAPADVDVAMRTQARALLEELRTALAAAPARAASTDASADAGPPTPSGSAATPSTSTTAGTEARRDAVADQDREETP